MLKYYFILNRFSSKVEIRIFKLKDFSKFGVCVCLCVCAHVYQHMCVSYNLNYAYFPGKFLFRYSIFKLQFSAGKIIANSALLETTSIKLYCFSLQKKYKYFACNERKENISSLVGRRKLLRESHILAVGKVELAEVQKFLTQMYNE